MNTPPRIGGQIGRGERLSVAKAALIAYYEHDGKEVGFIYSGMLNFFHRAVDIAGAEHCGPGTHEQVLSILRSSPMWDISGTIPGWGQARANTYKPSQKGQDWVKSKNFVACHDCGALGCDSLPAIPVGECDTCLQNDQGS